MFYGRQSSAANALQEIGDPELSADSVPLLVKALGNADPLVRSWSARALAQIGPQAKPALHRIANGDVVAIVLADEDFLAERWQAAVRINRSPMSRNVA